MKLVLVPSIVNKPLIRPLALTFNDNVEVRMLCNTIITDYSSEEQLRRVKAEIERNIDSVLRTISKSDELYLMYAGGIFNTVIAKNKLDREGVKYRALIYEKKLSRFVVVDPETVEVLQ